MIVRGDTKAITVGIGAERKIIASDGKMMLVEVTFK